MAKPPVLKDWKGSLENQLESACHRKEDLQKIIYLCQDYFDEMRPAAIWISEHERFVERITAQFREMYMTLFGQEPPPRAKEMTVSEVLLNTPERRKQTVREVALAITKPGDNVSDEAVLEELKRRGMKLVADNPTATISTILHGFKPQFEKVKDKRGVFRRQE
jgi:hypothetical protein